LIGYSAFTGEQPVGTGGESNPATTPGQGSWYPAQFVGRLVALASDSSTVELRFHVPVLPGKRNLFIEENPAFFVRLNSGHV